jgi:hypothetical protein
MLGGWRPTGEAESSGGELALKGWLRRSQAEGVPVAAFLLADELTGSSSGPEVGF